MKIKPIDTSDIEKIDTNNSSIKIPFSNLLKKGLIKPGEKIFNSRESIKATVLSNGNLKFKKVVGSIHKVGAYVQNKPSCNGWTFWYVRQDNKVISINDHRNFLREATSSRE